MWKNTCIALLILAKFPTFYAKFVGIIWSAAVGKRVNMDPKPNTDFYFTVSKHLPLFISDDNVSFFSATPEVSKELEK